MRFWNNRDINNAKHITTIFDVSTIEACMDLCLANSDCVTINHYMPSNHCFLYEAPSTLGTSRLALSTSMNVAVRCDHSFEPTTADGHYSPSPGKK